MRREEVAVRVGRWRAEKGGMGEERDTEREGAERQSPLDWLGWVWGISDIWVRMGSSSR